MGGQMWVDYACCFSRATIWIPRLARVTFMLVLLLVILVVPKLPAQSTEEFDYYHVKLGGFWVYSTPTGTIQGSATTDLGSVDLVKDLNFQTYSTFFGKLDWKFTHKNHIYVFGSRLTSSKETVLTRTITFEGKTFVAGAHARERVECSQCCVCSQ